MILFKSVQDAIDTPFTPNRNPQYNGIAGPSGITSLETQSAIEEAYNLAISNDRFVILAHYGGNANTGRYLEMFPNEGSDGAPLFLAIPSKLLSVTFQTSAASATATIGFFDLNVSSVTPVYSLALVAAKRVTAIGTAAAPLASFLANAQVAMRVTSGSLNTPTLQFSLNSYS